MPKTKFIRIKMANGKTRQQKVQVLRSGKFKFVKNTAHKIARRAKSGAKRVKHRITRRKTPKSRPSVRSNNRKRSGSKSMAGGFLKKIPLINNPTVRKVFIAAGAASIIVSILSLISPRAASVANSTVGRGVIGLATGDIVGAVSNVVLPMIQGGQLGNLTGGNNGGNQAVQGTAGFA